MLSLRKTDELRPLVELRFRVRMRVTAMPVLSEEPVAAALGNCSTGCDAVEPIAHTQACGQLQQCSTQGFLQGQSHTQMWRLCLLHRVAKPQQQPRRIATVGLRCASGPAP